MDAAHGWGGASRAGFQPPRVGSRHVQASQAFTPSLSKGGVFSVHPLILCRSVQPTFESHRIRMLHMLHYEI
jgi:hypothetical protein